MSGAGSSEPPREIARSIFIVGAGRVGAALASLLARAGLPLIGIWSRGPSGARRARQITGLDCHHGAFPATIGDAKAVIIATRDPEVPSVASALLDGGLLRGASVVLHCGGAIPAAQALAPIAPVAATGTLHPLVAVADPGQAVRLIPRGFFAVEGDLAARALGHHLAAVVGARSFEVEAERMPLYHAAAVVASNHAVALWHSARELLVAAGLDPALASAALVELVRGTVENVEALGLPEALTGPVRRGDAGTVRRHLEVLAETSPGLLPLYRACTAAAARAVQGTPEGDRLAAALEAIITSVEG